MAPHTQDKPRKVYKRGRVLTKPYTFSGTSRRFRAGTRKAKRRAS